MAISEEDIERFVRYPETLAPVKREAIARQLDTDATARRIATFYLSFYRDLGDLEPGGGDDMPSPDLPNGDGLDSSSPPQL